MWSAGENLEAYLRNRTYFLCFHTVKETRVDITGNEKLKCTMHDRDVLKIIAIRSNDLSDWRVFKNCRKAVNNDVKLAKEMYYKNAFHENEGIRAKLGALLINLYRENPIIRT